jgi:hypothetical protein
MTPRRPARGAEVAVGAVAVILVLAASCTARDGGSSRAVTAPPVQAATTPPPSQPAVAVPTSAAAGPQPVLRGVGQPFTVDGMQLTLLSAQDPFPPTPQTQPQPGNRLVSVKYEVVNMGAAAGALTNLPVLRLLDATGTGYTSEHGRLSLIAGGASPGDLLPGKRMESSVLFEVPAGAGGLRAAFSAAGDDRVALALITLD